MAKNQRGLKGHGHFIKNEAGYIYKLLIGTYENGRSKYLSFSGNTKTKAYNRAMEYKATHLDMDALSENPALCDYIRLWLKIYKKESKAVRPQTYTRMCSVTEHQKQMLKKYWAAPKETSTLILLRAIYLTIIAWRFLIYIINCIKRF